MGSSGGAGGGAGALTLIESQTLTAIAASITFSAIPQTYKDLIVSWQARCDNAATANVLSLRLNGDAAASYDYEDVTVGNATLTGAAALAQTSARVGAVNAASAEANVGAAGELWLPNYAGSSFFKSYHSQQWRKDSNIAANCYSEWAAGHWKSTAAVTSLTLLPPAGNFIVGSVFSLYGRG